MTWKPDLGARFSKLQEAVVVIQHAQPHMEAAAAGGLKAPNLSDPPGHETDGHDESHLPRSGLSGDADTPANGTLNFHTPMPSHLLDSSLGSGFVSGQLIAGLGQTPPSLSFPQF